MFSTVRFPKLFQTLALWGIVAFAASAFSAPVKPGHTEAELIAERTATTPGEPLAVALRLRMDPHWHTYWKNPGDSGMPTAIKWNLPEGFVAGPIQWPVPERIPTGPLVNYGYSGEVLLLVDIQTPPALRTEESVTIAAHANWLECKDVCIPEQADLKLTLPVKPNKGDLNADSADLFQASRDELPRPLSGWKVSAQRNGKIFEIFLEPGNGDAPAIRELYFFSEDEGVVEASGAQKLERSGKGYRLSVPVASQASGEIGKLAGLLVTNRLWKGTRSRAAHFSTDLSVAPVQDANPLTQSAPTGAPRSVSRPQLMPSASRDAASLTLIAAIAFAFVGGSILNLMPCVLPIISLKVLGFAARGEGAAARRHAWVFAAGIIISFWVLAVALLALRAAGEAIGWGFQLQSPVVVTALAVLFFVMALNLSGAFEFGQFLPDSVLTAQARSPYVNSFLNGVLACVVAAPCTAPFMGAALGFAAAQPALIAMTVFTALGAGMAAPYVVLGHFPAALKRLPKPGLWMIHVKQFLAFPLYATVLWLAWVLGLQVGLDGVIRFFAAMITLGLAVWVLSLRGGKRYRWPAVAIVVVALGILWPLGRDDLMRPVAAGGANNPALAEEGWQPYSKAAVDGLLSQGKPVFIDFTAAWCVTCQVNKRVVLNTESVRKAFADNGVVLVRADWTKRDADITDALKALGRNGVPVYVLLRPGGEALLLPEVLREKHITEALATLGSDTKAAMAKKVQAGEK